MKQTRDEYLGTASIHPQDEVIVGSYGTWTLTYVVGKYGIDDGGTILIAYRTLSDWGRPQFVEPGQCEYTVVTTSGQAILKTRYDPQAYIRPWKAALRIDVHEGTLAPGDLVTIVLGDTSGGGSGSRAQTFPEQAHEFRVLVDPFGTGHVAALPDSPTLRLVSGPAVRLVVLVPSQCVMGQSCTLLVKAVDRYGNPARSYTGSVACSSTDASASLPARYVFTTEDQGVHRFEITFSTTGLHQVVIEDEGSKMRAASNPILCRKIASEFQLFWGDIHGQTEETVGTGSLDEYFHYGRDAAALDFIAHAGNAFQVTREHYTELAEKIQAYHVPGHFVTFLGYEWSGNTPAGGDHNIYFLRDDEPIHRCTHWLVEDRSDEEADRYPLTELLNTFRGRRDVMVIPHIGGRRANLDLYDPTLMPLIEICSCHGRFEWFAQEALARGLKVGFIASSDDHTGRPGAHTPGFTPFGVRGGLIAAYATQLSREALWEAFWQRRCYATTGERIILHVLADSHMMGEEYATDEAPEIAVMVAGTAPLAAVEIVRGLALVYSHPLAQVSGNKIKILWRGARSKERARRTKWDGHLTIVGGKFLAAQELAFDRPDEGLIEVAAERVAWRSSTCGDVDGLLVELEAGNNARLSFVTEPASFSFSLEELTSEPLRVEAGGIEQQVVVAKAPAEETPRTVNFLYRGESIQPGVHAYYVRVTQEDGEMAWSSPLFVWFERRDDKAR